MTAKFLKVKLPANVSLGKKRRKFEKILEKHLNAALTEEIRWTINQNAIEQASRIMNGST